MKKIKKKIISTIVSLMSFMPSASLVHASDDLPPAPPASSLEEQSSKASDIELELSKKLNWEKIINSHEYYRIKNILVNSNGKKLSYVNGNVELKQVIIPEKFVKRIPEYISQKNKIKGSEWEPTAIDIAGSVLGGVAIVTMGGMVVAFPVGFARGLLGRL